MYMWLELESQNTDTEAVAAMILNRTMQIMSPALHGLALAVADGTSHPTHCHRPDTKKLAQLAH